MKRWSHTSIARKFGVCLKQCREEGSKHWRDLFLLLARVRDVPVGAISPLAQVDTEDDVGLVMGYGLIHLRNGAEGASAIPFDEYLDIVFGLVSGDESLYAFGRGVVVLRELGELGVVLGED